MPVDTSQFERRRRGIDDDYAAKRTANEFGRFTSQQRFHRDYGAFTRDFQRRFPNFNAGFGRRGLTGPNVQSGVHQRAMQDFVGDHTRQGAERQQDFQSEQTQFDQSAASFEAARQRALADLEAEKAAAMAQAALEIQGLRPLF
jgi:hypothetical protein